jgi:hypothetical protein
MARGRLHNPLPAPPRNGRSPGHLPVSHFEPPATAALFSSPVLSSASRLGRAGGSCSLDRTLAMQDDELVLGPLSRQQESRLPRQNFSLNLPTNRRLCSTVGGRIVEGCAAHCCAVSAARSRAATMTNLARSSLAFVLPALFGAARSCALVNLCMICPRWSAIADDESDSAPDHGHLMASVRTRSFSHPLPADSLLLAVSERPDPPPSARRTGTCHDAAARGATTEAILQKMQRLACVPGFVIGTASPVQRPPAARLCPASPD